MSRISRAELDELRSRVTVDARSALELLRVYEGKYTGDPNFEYNRGSFLADIGLDLGDLELVEAGVELMQVWLQRVPKKLRPHLLYNLANGHYALYWVAKSRPGYAYNPVTTSLTIAKNHYREALSGRKCLPKDLLARLHVNFGNCLSGLGRTLEAIRQHDLALDYVPDHAMALGNLGVELEFFSAISSEYGILEDALSYLDRALSSKNLESIGGSQARAQFEQARARVYKKVSLFAARGVRPPVVEVREVKSEYQRYVEFCRRHDLLLNFATRHGQPSHANEDSVFFSMITPTDDSSTYPRLSRIVNETKERYVTARLLLYEACCHPYDTQPYDDMVFFGDNDDRAVYGVRPGKLKLAFEGAYNIFDKIALFVRDRFDLQVDDRVDYGRIWREESATSLRDPIVKTGNRQLFALYDISTDLGPSGYMAQLGTLRNFLTHRYVVVHTAGQTSWRANVDSGKYHVEYKRFAESTIELMRLVRYAVTYLSAFLHSEYRSSRRTARIAQTKRIGGNKHYAQGPLGGLVSGGGNPSGAPPSQDLAQEDRPSAPDCGDGQADCPVGV